MSYSRAPDAYAAFLRLPALAAANPNLCDDGWIPRHNMPMRTSSPHLYSLLQLLPFFVERARTKKSVEHIRSYAECALIDAGEEHNYVSKGELILCMLALGYTGKIGNRVTQRFGAKVRDRCVLPRLAKLPVAE